MSTAPDQQRGTEVGTAADSGLPSPYLVFLGDVQHPAYAKTAFGLRDWAGDKCVGQFALADAQVDLGLPAMSPAQARAAGARALVIGIANEGGVILPSWIPALRQALEAGLDLVSGMHVRLLAIDELRHAAEVLGRRMIDVRVPPPGLRVGTGLKRSGQRLLTVGTDCALGKKYTALAIVRAMTARGIAADFRATGQTGIMIAGSGIPMDAVVSDFAAGAAETLSPDAADDHWDVIEGQGSLVHPAYAGVSLALLHGSQPDVFVVCHDPSRTRLLGDEAFAMPSVEEIIELTIALGSRTNPAIRCAGVSLNTSQLEVGEARLVIAAEQARLGLPVADPIRGDPAFAALVDACLAP